MIKLRTGEPYELIKYSRLLRTSPGFTRLWAAQVISLLGDWFNTIVLSARIVDFTDGSGLAVSIFLMTRFLPPLLIGPLAGVLVDRFDRKRILIFSNITRAFIVLAFLMTTSPDTLWLIYALTILQFMVSALFEPGQAAILPSLVPQESLTIANTLTSVTWSVMLAVGAIAGGVVAAIFGESTALVIDAMTFAVAAWIIAGIRPKRADPPASNEPASDQRESGSFLAGLRYLRANKRIASALLVKGGTSIGSVDVLATVYATQIFVIGANGQLSLGILYSVFGIGAILGPLILNRYHQGKVNQLRRLIVVGFLWAIVGWVVMGAATSLVFVAFAVLIRGLGGSANWTYSSVILQSTVPDRFLGRVFSLDFAVFQLAVVLSTLAHGAIVELLTGGLLAAQWTSMHPAFAHQVSLIQGGYIHERLSTLAFATGVISVVPLLMWAGFVFVIERRPQKTAATSTDPRDASIKVG